MTPLRRWVGIPPPGQAPDYMGAITVLAALAYPSEKDAKARDVFVKACKARVIKAAQSKFVDRGGDRAAARAKIRKEYSGLPNKKIEQALARAWKRISLDRYPAGMMADWLLIIDPPKGNGGLRFRYKVGVKQVDSVNDAYDAVQDQLKQIKASTAGKNNRANVRRNIWNPSKPVLHLALAFVHELKTFKKGQISIDSLIFYPRWARAVIDRSEKLLPHLVMNSKIQLKINDGPLRLKYLPV